MSRCEDSLVGNRTIEQQLEDERIIWLQAKIHELQVEFYALTAKRLKRPELATLGD